MARPTSNRRKQAFIIPVAPTNRLEANSWLNKIQYGAATRVPDIQNSTKTNFIPLNGSVDDADRLMSIGYQAYVDESFSADSMVQPRDLYLSGIADETFGGANNGVFSLYIAWFMTTGIYGNCRARSKATFALSQIFSMRPSVGATNTYLQHLYDATLSTNTSSFREMLKRITFLNEMGRWLTFVNNSKTDTNTGARPDQNYAREILQLYSIGLTCLNMDGTPVLDEFGEPVPTYTNEDIVNFADFFTGMGGGGDASQPYMFPFKTQISHETNAKTLFAYPGGSRVIFPAQDAANLGYLDIFAKPNGYTVTVLSTTTFSVVLDKPRPETVVGSTVCRYKRVNAPGAPVFNATYGSTTLGQTTLTLTTQTAHGLVNGDIIYSKSNIEESIDAAIDHIFNHPTLPPYYATSLIKLLVTSNPSPQYVRRVAEKFVNNGNLVRGDLSAVFKAIYMDREAILPFGKNPNNFGKYTSLWDRAMRMASQFRCDIVHSLNRNTPPNGNANNPLAKGWGSFVGDATKDTGLIIAEPRTAREYGAMQIFYNQGHPIPLQHASVFNFYRPGFTPANTTLGNNGFTAPEFQITSPDSQASWVNIVLAACDYQKQDGGRNSLNAFTDVRSNPGEIVVTGGIDFTPNPQGFTITSIAGDRSTATLTGFIRDNASFNNNSRTMNTYNRRADTYSNSALRFSNITKPVNNLTEVSTIIVTVVPADWQVNDVIDFIPRFTGSGSGFFGRGLNLGGGAGNINNAFGTLYHVAASKLPENASPATITQTELDVAINYLESICMSRPISAQIRQYMSDVAILPITLPANSSSFTVPGISDATLLNKYTCFSYNNQQIMIRRMIAVLCVSPEYSIQV